MRYILIIALLMCGTAVLAGEPGDEIKLSLKNNYNESFSNFFDISDDRYDNKGYWTSARPDGHAPIGVMGDHVHGAKEIMFSYRYMNMYMNGNLVGTDEVIDQEIVSVNGTYQYMVTPKSMTMQMHMFGVMYAPINSLTLMAMVPYVQKSMDHLTRNGTEFTTESNGIGDVTLTGIIKLLNKNRNSILGNIGIIFPTGSIDAMDVTPASDPNETILPYPMQLGGGTFGFSPAVTYLGQSKIVSWGVQTGATIRFGENSRDYRLGNQYFGTAWGAAKLADWISTSLRLTANRVDNIEGADTTLNPAMIPTADPDLRAGTRVDAAIGFNIYSYTGGLRNLRFGIEGSSPIYQDLDGPQLKNSWTITAGVQYSFSLDK